MNMNEAATKQDIQNLAAANKKDIQELANATRRDIQNLAAVNKRAIQDLAASTKQDIHDILNLISEFMVMVNERFDRLEANTANLNARVNRIEKHLSRKRVFPRLKLKTES